MTPLGDPSLTTYERRMHFIIWRSYALQATACLTGALMMWCAAQCAINGYYGQSCICASALVLSLMMFTFGARERVRAHKTLEILNR